MSWQKSIIRDKRVITVLLSLMILFWVLLGSNFFYTLNKWFQNGYYHFKDSFFEKQPSKDIIVVEIDEKTIEKLWRFPFDRKVYTNVIDNLKSAGVAVVGMDIIFADRTNIQSDEALEHSFSKAGNVVIGNAILDNGKIEDILPSFDSAVLTKWFFPPLIDTRNNTVYSLDPFKHGALTPNGQNPYAWQSDHFSLALLKGYLSYIYGKDIHTFDSKYDSQNFYIGDKITIPFSRVWKKEILINFIDNHKFTRVSFSDVYDKDTFDIIKEKVDFKDKIILIGAAAKGIKDVFSTPNGIEYGVYIHANMLNTILKQDYLVYFDKNLEWILIFFLIILSVYFNLSKSSYVLIFSNLSIITIFLVVLPITIIVFTNVIMNYSTELIFALVLSLTVSNIAKYLIENRQKDKLNRALSEYVSEDIAREILSWDGRINLDGEKKNITIFFSDIAGFTTISEQLTPETLLPYLRDYLTVMSNVIIDEKGFINKYEWDAIMALWWAFWHQDTMEKDACEAALLQLKFLEIMNKKLEKKNLPKVAIRVGIHSGDAVIGNIGAAGRKIEFTALWDNVNLASRLEWVNKFYGTQICVSEDVYNKVKDLYEFRFLDTIRVKWKSISLKIYELLAQKDKLKKDRKIQLQQFEVAMEQYIKKDFLAAKKIFSTISWDGPSTFYSERCEYFIHYPPNENWDGIWEMKEK